jgi:type I restriction enzyme, S subunit
VKWEVAAMSPEHLLKHFEQIAEAPDAVPRLRRFILDLAVRGKLVEQDPADEPAGELLKRIEAEKKRLVKEVKIKKQISAQQDNTDGQPFGLPDLWAWSALGEVSLYGLPDKVDSNKKLAADTWVLDLEDIEKDTSRLIDRVCSEARPFQSSKTRFKKGDVLFGKLRPYLNKVLVADADGVCTTEIVPVRALGGIAPEYIRLVLKSPLTMERVDRLMYGMKMPRLGTNDALELNFPLPPLAEQHRIVAKVGELMALCDELEAAQAKRERRRDRLVSATLNGLNNGDTSSGTGDLPSCQESARFFFNHLPRLTTRAEHIQQLRQTILNLAVRGKLVPQTMGDEPAFILQKRLTAEVKSYASQTGFTSSKPEPVTNGTIPWPAPSGWIWTKLSMLCKSITDGDHQPPPKTDDGIAFLTIGNVTSGRLDFSNCRFVSEEYYNSLAVYRKPSCGDILYTVVGATFGRPAMVDSDRNFCVQRHIAILKPTSELNVRYLCLLLASPFVYEQATRSTTGTAQPTVPLKPLRNFLIPLPPLAEQHRIVARVDELMALCDDVVAELTITATTRRQLLEAFIQEALTP